jgi:hypothetical protein
MLDVGKVWRRSRGVIRGEPDINEGGTGTQNGG